MPPRQVFHNQIFASANTAQRPQREGTASVYPEVRAAPEVRAVPDVAYRPDCSRRGPLLQYWGELGGVLGWFICSMSRCSIWRIKLER